MVDVWTIFEWSVEPVTKVVLAHYEISVFVLFSLCALLLNWCLSAKMDCGGIKYSFGSYLIAYQFSLNQNQDPETLSVYNAFYTWHHFKPYKENLQTNSSDWNQSPFDISSQEINLISTKLCAISLS